MSILKEALGQYEIGKILNSPLRIPPYQRPYSWQPETALRLLYDLLEAFENEAQTYLLGTLVLHKNDQDGQTFYDIVDGQHRLLTLKLIINLLENNAEVPVSNTTPLAQVHHALAELLWRRSLKREELIDFICKKCHLFQVVTDDLDEAFRIFDTQNTRGKPLEPHELLKAHHLRAIKVRTSEADKLIQWWDEQTGDKNRKQALNTLFSRYLYPIARWLRDESAQEPFSDRHLNLFKGFADMNMPAARYHQHASQWDAWSHDRFQLDAPMQDGLYFFEFTQFMYEELNDLARKAFNGRFEFSYYGQPNDEPALIQRGKTCYRYVTELYLAALFYFINRFGTKYSDEARDTLMKWAYTVRVTKLRLEYSRIDNHARGHGERNDPNLYPLFRKLCHATDPLELLLEIPTAKQGLAEPKEGEDLREDRQDVLNKVFG